MVDMPHFRPIGARPQRTVGKSVSYRGVGLHTGEPVDLCLKPAQENFGIQFQRVDCNDQPLVPATVDSVTSTLRRTTLGRGDMEVHTVEHLLAAIKAFQIDNLCIQLSASEPPAAGGSAVVFTDLIEQAGIVEQGRELTRFGLDRPVWWRDKSILLAAFPADAWRVDYTLHYPDVPGIGTQYCSFVVDCDTFVRELAPCRTFALENEVESLRAAGLIRGGSLDNAVIIKDGEVVNSGGLRFSNEMARHKALDIVGDLALVARDFTAHIVAVRSGHEANVAFACCLSKHFT